MSKDIMKKPNNTAMMICKILEDEGKPLHLKVLAERTKKTKEACYTAIHKEPLLFKKTKPSTYYLKTLQDVTQQ